MAKKSKAKPKRSAEKNNNNKNRLGKLTPEELAELSPEQFQSVMMGDLKRRHEACSKEIAAALEKYGFTLSTEPQIVLRANG